MERFGSCSCSPGRCFWTWRADRRVTRACIRKQRAARASERMLEYRLDCTHVHSHHPRIWLPERYAMVLNSFHVGRENQSNPHTTWSIEDGHRRRLEPSNLPTSRWGVVAFRIHCHHREWVGRMVCLLHSCVGGDVPLPRICRVSSSEPERKRNRFCRAIVFCNYCKPSLF